MKKIDDEYNRVDLIDKGLKRIQKTLGTQTLSKQKEAELIKRKEFIKASRPFIERKEQIDKILSSNDQKKKEVSKPLKAIY